MYNHSITLAIRQAERWILATQQDKHPAVKNLHADYAVATLDLIRQLWSDRDIQRITGRDPFTLLSTATTLQDESASILRSLCPTIK